MFLAHGTVSDNPSDAHSIERFREDVEALGFRQGGDAGRGSSFILIPVRIGAAFFLK